MYILSISAFYHDSAAALIQDGEIIAAAEEERFTRKKHDSDFPQQAIDYCLQEAGIGPERLDYVGFYDKPLAKFERLLETYLAYAPRGLMSFCKAMPPWLRQKLHLPREMDCGLSRRYRKRYVFCEHHEAHAASTFFPSPFEEAVSEFIDFLKDNKKWWLLPIAAVLVLVGLLMFVGGGAASPFIYTLF